MRRSTIQHVSFLTLVVLVTVAFVALLLDFLQPVFWAAVFAVLFFPLQRRCEQWTRGRESLAALLTLLIIVVIVIVPFFLIGLAVSNEAVNLYERIASGELDPRQALRWLEQGVPVADRYLARFDLDLTQLQERLSNAAVVVSQFLAAQALAFGQNAVRIGALFFLMLYVLFFFLRDGDRLLEAVVRALPIGDVRERRLFAKFAEVTRATLKGTLVVGFVQGTMGGLLFWLLGLSAPVFWGVIMTVLSLLPAIGAGLVWGPAAVILLLSGSVVRGIILIAAGTLLIGLVDNILRPLLVGRDTKMPDYLILLSTLGGLAAFGISGFVLGPVIAALFLAVWQMFEEEYSTEEGHTLLVTPDPLPAEPAPTGRPPRPDAEPADPDPPQ